MALQLRERWKRGFLRESSLLCSFDKRKGVASEMFVGKLRTSILRLSKGEAMLARVAFGLPS